MILENIGSLTTFNPGSGEVETISNTSLAIEDGIIVKNGNGEFIDCGGALITPGFVDPHTHPVFLDGREEEFAQDWLAFLMKRSQRKAEGSSQVLMESEMPLKMS